MIATWCYIPSTVTVDIITKNTNIDCIIIDMEHGPINIETAFNMVKVAKSNGKNAYIRICDSCSETITKVLDTGCYGILAPHITSVADAMEFQDSCLYPNLGKRGLSPFTPVHNYDNSILESSSKVANANLKLGILIEDREGLKNLDDILEECNHIDIVYLGLYDLSQELAYGNLNSSKMKEVIERAFNIIRCNQVIAGIFCNTWKDVEMYKNMGFEFIAYSCDAHRLHRSYFPTSYPKM